MGKTIPRDTAFIEYSFNAGKTGKTINQQERG